MTRGDVLRKCIIVFDAIRRQASKGNAGLEPEKGAEEEFAQEQEICDTLRQMLREMEAGEYRVKNTNQKMRDWQKEIMEHGAPERLVF